MKEQQFYATLENKPDYILDVLINLLLLVLFLLSPGVHGLSLVVVTISFFFFGVVKLMTFNLFAEHIYDLLNSIYFSVLAVLISYFTGISIYDLTIPILVLLLMSYGDYVLLPPIVVACSFGIATRQFDLNSMAIYFGIFLGCWLLQRRYIAKSK